MNFSPQKKHQQDYLCALLIFSSKKINCPHCNCTNNRNGQKTYYHQVLKPLIVFTQKKQVINLPPFIRKQDGKNKQDCENVKKKCFCLLRQEELDGKWKIENQGNNTLKNQGDNLESNFGQVKENLSEILLSLNLLSFQDDNILELVNLDYQKIREKLVKRKTFLKDLQAPLKYIWLISWEDLLIFILTEGDERKLINSK